MPSHKIHCYADRVMFGRSYRQLHEALDKPYWVLGRRHRIVFHDGWSATEVAKRVFPADPVAQESAAAHVLLDELCSSDRYFHNSLKALAEMDSQGRKRARSVKGRSRKKKRLVTSPAEKLVKKTFRQLLEIQRLNHLIKS